MMKLQIKSRYYDYSKYGDLALQSGRTQCLGIYMGHPVPGGYNYGDLALQVGGISRIGTIKYGIESRKTALARTNTNSKLQTRPLVREGATK
jgi:hypothetical protein